MDTQPEPTQIRLRDDAGHVPMLDTPKMAGLMVLLALAFLGAFRRIFRPLMGAF